MQFWKAFAEAVLRAWGRGWDAELVNCVFVALSLAGLIITLLVHQNKQFLEQPQLSTFDSLVSIFTFFIKAGLAMILTEVICYF